jgi:hypothetical protein
VHGLKPAFRLYQEQEITGVQGLPAEPGTLDHAGIQVDTGCDAVAGKGKFCVCFTVETCDILHDR